MGGFVNGEAIAGDMSALIKTAFFPWVVESHDGFRNMRARDLPQVLAIEQACYRYPWSESIYRDCLRIGYCGKVFVQASEICAYGIMSTGVGEAHILNLCVDPRFQCRGMGRAMLDHLLGIARQRKVDTCFLEVRPSNKIAIRLYKRAGFRKVGVRRGYYPAALGREDAVVMSVDLPVIGAGQAS